MTVTTQATFAATLVDEWVRAGVGHAVVAPGSRSTPLALALAADGRLHLHVHLDERSAAFYAVGIGMASRRPAVVVTTSGTAAVETHPAVVEAHQAGVPLVVCTADRPSELHGVSAPQTVVQSRLFGEAVRFFADPGAPEGFPPGAWRSLAARAVAEALASPLGPGPVHLNLAFRDPLVGEPGPLPPARPGGRPWHEVTPAEAPPAELDPDLFAGRRGVVVAGWGSDSEAVARLAAALGWPVLADARSGLRGTAGAVAAFDALLRDRGFAAAMAPEVVVRVGAPPASKVLATWLGALDALQVVVDPFGRWPDPERAAAVVVRAVPDVDPGPDIPGWLDRWVEAEARAQAAIDAVLAGHAEPTEPAVARALSGGLPADVGLFTSSSMPVRDVEWYGDPSSARLVLANRGANGIDGVVSTALGVAAAGVPTVALVGDLAFLHDAGGLLWAPAREVDCTFVVVDNHGGGIFSFLPQAAALDGVTFERLFGTPHGLDLGAVAAAYGVPVHTVSDDVLAPVLGALAGGGVHVVHVRTNRAANVAVHDEIHRAVAAAIADL